MPFAPHITSELLEQNNVPINDFAKWPIFDPSKLKQSTALIAVQINGKVRATLELQADIDEQAALAAARSNEVVAKWLGQGVEKRAVYIAGKVINFVVG